MFRRRPTWLASILAIPCTLGVAAALSAQPPAGQGFTPYAGSAGSVTAPAAMSYPTPGVYAGRVFNPAGAPDIPLTAGESPRYTAQWPRELSRAQLVVKLPPSAKLWVNGRPTKQLGSARSFVTPATLIPGVSYRYAFRAEWTENGRPVTRERTVDFQADRETVVDFNPPVTGPGRQP